jgi:hypothetical protein
MAGRLSLNDLRKRYGQGADFGGYDYHMATTRHGYSPEEVFSWMKKNVKYIHPDNRAGGPNKMWEEAKGFAQGTGKVPNRELEVRIDRGGADQGMTGAEYSAGVDAREHAQDLERIKVTGATTALINGLKNDADRYIADAAAASNRFGQIQETARKKIGEQGATDRQTIQGKFDLLIQKAKDNGAKDLQKIVNAGASDVETIRDKGATARTKLEGYFGLESDKIRGASAEKIANTQSTYGMFQSALSGFWS